MAVVHQEMRQRKPRRPHASDHDAFTRWRLGIGIAQVQRIPTRQQAVNLEAPGQFEDVLQRARFRLRNIDRFLLLVDAGLHAVVADAVAGCCSHRIVDGDNRQRANGKALGLGFMEF